MLWGMGNITGTTALVVLLLIVLVVYGLYWLIKLAVRNGPRATNKHQDQD